MKLPALAVRLLRLLRRREGKSRDKVKSQVKDTRSKQSALFEKRANNPKTLDKKKAMPYVDKSFVHFFKSGRGWDRVPRL